MAVDFWIHITPTKERFHDVFCSLSESLLNNGWTLHSVLYDNGRNLTDFLQPTKEWLFRQRKGQASFIRASRRLVLDFDFQRPGSILLGGGIGFFHVTDPFAEMKRIFGDARLPPGTEVKGDVEGMLDMDRPSWFFWIAQMEPAKWDELLDKLPEAANRELARVGESHLVMLSDSPYGRGDDLTRLIGLIGDTRPRPSRGTKG